MAPGVGQILSGCLPVHCMNTSCMSCVYDIFLVHIILHMCFGVLEQDIADVRSVFAEFLVVVRRLILRNSKGNDQIS